MVDFAGAEALKGYPILQMIIGGVVALVAIIITIRGAKNNEKDGHIAPVGHDPLGLTVMANSVLGLLGTISELIRQMLGEMRELHHEQIKTNSRLAEMKDAHASEMDRLRDAVDGLKRHGRQ